MIRRHSAAFSVLMLLYSAHCASAEPMLAVVVKGDNAVNLYRPKNAGIRLIKAVPVGKRPGELCQDPAGKYLYLGQGADKNIAVIDLATQTVTGTLSDPGLEVPDGCAVSPDGTKLYMVDLKANAVFVFSTASAKPLGKIPVGDEPRRALFSNDGKMLLVSNAHSNSISVIDPATDKVIRTVKTGREPRDMLWSPDGKTLVVAMVVDDAIAYYKAGTLEFENQAGTERSPQRIAITPDGLTLFSLSRFRNAVTVTDLTGDDERRVVSSIPVGRNAFGMTMSPDGKYVYTTHLQFDNSISVIDVRTMRLVNTFPVGKDPNAMLYTK